MIGPLDYAAIRRQIPIRRVLELLNWEPTVHRGGYCRGPCPFCRSSPGRTSGRPRQEHSLSVETQRNLFHCFRCHSGGNQLDLWAAATGQPLYAATLDLCRRLGVTPISRENSQPPTKA
jgi:DNA primase